jgi:hypothetical protein
MKQCERWRGRKESQSACERDPVIGRRVAGPRTTLRRPASCAEGPWHVGGGSQERGHLTVCAAKARGAEATDGRTRARTGAGRDRGVAAEHADARSELGSTEGNHVLADPTLAARTNPDQRPPGALLPDVTRDHLAMLRARMREHVLDQVIAVLIARD